jgi:putative tryptophan/tyrosine transport system substrate-binding protein
MRKLGIFILISFIMAGAQPAGAQKPQKSYRVGYLTLAGAMGHSVNYNTFRQGLRELGHVEGHNLFIESRTAENRSRLGELATELVEQKVDVIVAQGPAAIAAKKASTTIPIVFSFSGEPVEAGLVASLARPGGNLTGMSFLAFDLVGKRLELLKEAAPKVSRIAVLSNPEHPGDQREFQETQIAARNFGSPLQYMQVKTPADFDGAFDTVSKWRANGLLVFPSALTNSHRERIVEFAAKSRLPGVYGWKEYVDAGGLMSYGPNQDEAFRRVAVFVDKILKGAKPADLPVEQPMRFELVINLKAAKQIGLTIPPNVLARADRIMK